MQSLPITTNIVSSNPFHGKLYSIQRYVIKFVNDATGQWYSPVSSINKNGRHDRTEILLRVALNTINHQISEMNNLSLFNDFKFNVTVDVGCENTAMEDHNQQDICFLSLG